MQYQWYGQMAYNNTYNVKAISESAFEKMQNEIPQCVKLIDQCQTDVSVCSTAQMVCNNAQLGPYERSGLNVYDVRMPCKVPGLCCK